MNPRQLAAKALNKVTDEGAYSNLVLSSLLKENEIRGIEYCSKCGNKFGSRKPKKVTVNKENHLMCEHCAIDIVEEINNTAAQKSIENNNDKIWKGILGSVVFSLILP